MLDPPSKDKISEDHRISIKACHSSITQMYQHINCLTDVKRVGESKHSESENRHAKEVLSEAFTMRQIVLIVFSGY